LTLCFLTVLSPEWWGFGKNDDSRMFFVQGLISQSVISSLPFLSKLSESPCRRPYGYYTTTKDEQTRLNEKYTNEEVESKENVIDSINSNGGNFTTITESTGSTSLMATDFNASMAELLDEISQRINDGSTEIMQDITNVLDEQLTQLPDSNAQELTEYIGGLANKIQKAQEKEVQRQIDELKKVFVQPLERVAFF